MRAYVAPIPEPTRDELTEALAAKTTAKRPKIVRFVTLYQSGESDLAELALDADIAPGTAKKWLGIVEGYEPSNLPFERPEMVQALVDVIRSSTSRDMDRINAATKLSGFFGWDKPTEDEQTPYHHRIAHEGLAFLDDTLRAIIQGDTGGPAFAYPEGVTVDEETEKAIRKTASEAAAEDAADLPAAASDDGLVE